MYGKSETNSSTVEDEFKKSFKYYKRKKPMPSMKNVLDFRSPNKHASVKSIEPTTCPEETSSRLSGLGVTDPKIWKIYSIDSQPGLIFIQNPFTSEGQCAWINRALNEYPTKPHKSNLDPQVELKDWPWSSLGYKSGGLADRLLFKLRWVTLGYHHNWDTKVYSEDNKHPFPEELASLSRVIAKATGFDDFSGEAAIVNYYHLDSTLAGHTDHSEKDMSAPLISISLGQSAVFLIGGRTKETVPVPLLLRSGDIVIMSGESRCCYHAVPRIMVESHYSLPWLDEDVNCNNYSNWSLWKKYLETSRININVRQVHPKVK